MLARIYIEVANGGLGRSTSYFENVQETISRLAAAIAEHEPVTMLAAEKHHALAAKLCRPGVALLDIPTDDMWVRDSGPVFPRNKQDHIAGDLGRVLAESKAILSKTKDAKGRPFEIVDIPSAVDVRSTRRDFFTS